PGKAKGTPPPAGVPGWDGRRTWRTVVLVLVMLVVLWIWQSTVTTLAMR
ncbi:MAG: hypothetical protein GWO24_29900, partial [Akkermansiaceae bacterium]|nr:hypothetical protein [Akkermansiaceae bacterium]